VASVTASWLGIAPAAETLQDYPSKPKIEDPDDFIFRLRHKQPLTRDEEEYVNLFHEKRGWDREQMAEHLDSLLQKTRFRNYDEKRKKRKAKEWAATFERNDIRLGALVVFVVFSLVVIAVDLLRLRAGRWLREREALDTQQANHTAESLLREAQDNSNR